MTYLLDFEIPCPKGKDLPRNLNSSIHDQKCFTWERAKWRRLIARYVYAVPPKPLTKAAVTYTRYSSREMDYDNLVFSFKFLQDALVKVGVLMDDNPSVVISSLYKWEKVGKGMGKIKIRVEEVK